MDSEDEDYEFDVDPAVPSDQDRTIRYESHRALSPSSSKQGDEYDSPPSHPFIQALDIPSVRRPPVLVMVPADRLSTHDLPLAESLSAVEREKYHNTFVLFFLNIGQFV